MSGAGDSVGGFTLVRPLKTHGLTEVWQGTREADGLDVAVKFAPSGSADARRLVREQAALSLVFSRHVVATAGFAEAEGRVVLAVEWCRGGTLKERLSKDGPLSVHVVCDLARDLLAALRDVHAAGVVHRDVKPGNVFLTEFGEARLGDFGISLLPGERPRQGAVIGSAAYLSPEQAAGGRLDARSDLYSLGLVLHESVTGRQVFSGGDFAAKLRRAATEEAPFVSSVAPDVPVRFARFVAALTTRDPALRPRNVLETLQAFRDML